MALPVRRRAVLLIVGVVLLVTWMVRRSAVGQSPPPPAPTRAPSLEGDALARFPLHGFHELQLANPAAAHQEWVGKHPGFPNVFDARSPAFVFNQCASDAEMAAIQLRMVTDKRASCAPETGHCKCPDNLLFDGEKCIPRGKQWADTVATLQGKWIEIPFVRENYVMERMDRTGVDVRSLPELSTVQWPSSNQVRTTFLASLSDAALVHLWKALAADDTFTMYYASVFRGKRVLDIGSGFARQSMRFALFGAEVWFVDVAESNVALLRRIADAMGVGANVHTASFSSIANLKEKLANAGMFDAVTAFGSMHHAPSEIIHEEVQVLTEHLKVGGRWLQLAYGLGMWDYYKYALFTRFGASTDVGDGQSEATPWAEWYSTGKLFSVFRPSRFVQLWCGQVTFEFVWFDLVYLGREGTQG